MQSFLPQLQQANTSLPVDHAGGSAFELVEENSDDEEDNEEKPDIKHRHSEDPDQTSDDDDAEEAGPQIVMVSLEQVFRLLVALGREIASLTLNDIYFFLFSPMQNLALGVLEEKKPQSDSSSSSDDESSDEDSTDDESSPKKVDTVSLSEDHQTDTGAEIKTSTRSEKRGQPEKRSLIQELS